MSSLPRAISESDRTTQLELRDTSVQLGRIWRRHQRSASTAWRRYVGVMLAIIAVLTAVRTAWPNEALVVDATGFVELLLIVSHTIALGYGLRRHRPPRRLPWLILLVSPFVIFMAVVADTIHREIQGQTSYPALADYLFLVALVPAVGFLAFVNFYRTSESDRAGLLDASIIAIACGLLAWILLIDPYRDSTELDAAAKVTLFSLPVIDVVMAWLIARMSLGTSELLVPQRALLCASVVLLCTDGVFTWLMLNDAVTPMSYGWCSTGWDVAYLLFLSLPLHPDMGKLVVRNDEPSSAGGQKRLAAISIAAIIAPVLIVVQDLLGGAEHSFVAAGGSIVMFILVISRMEGMLRRQEETSRALDESMRHVKVADVHLRHAQKLEAVGKLASGIAHEINTPAQVVQSNLQFLRIFNDSMIPLVEAHRQWIANCPPDSRREIDEALESSGVQRIWPEVSMAIDDAMNGVDRIADIVAAMREFGRPPRDDKEQIDLDQVVQNTLIVLSNQMATVADAVIEPGGVSAFEGYATDINQMILHLVLNAVDAITDDFSVTGRRGLLSVSTKRDDDSVLLVVSDTGAGISEDVLPRIFEPFFTTKAVGSGSGQGLAIVWNVVERHVGTIDVQSEQGMGTTFSIRLPVDRDDAGASSERSD